MAKNFEHVSHIKSKLPKENINSEEFYGLTPTVDNSDAEGSSPIKVKFPKLPTEDKLIEGEIAVNYLKGHETLSIKNSEKEIVGFVNENEFFQAQEIISSALGQEKNDRIESITKIEEKLDLKANVSDVYTKSEADEKFLGDIFNSENYYDKTEIDSKLATKANVSDVYTKSEIDSALQTINTKNSEQDAEIALKAVKTDVDAALELKADKTELVPLAKSADVTAEIAAAVGPLATKEEMNAVDGKFVEVNQKIDDNELVISAALNDLNASIIKHNEETYTKQEVNDLTSNFFDNVSYVQERKEIIFKNGDDVIATIDATDFIKDGMVSNVAISEGNLVITFNTDAGQEPISIALTDIFNPENYYDKTAMDGKLAAKANSADLAKVATSGSYNDLNDKPAIPERTEVDAALSDTSENPVQNKVVKAAIDTKQDASTAFSGDYNDLTNKPTIPAAQVNADWDASSGVAQILNKPTNVSAFTNDAGYLTEQQSLEKHYTKLEVDKQFDEIEYTVSASLNDLNARIEEMSSDNTNQFTAINKRITDFDEGIDDLELAVSSSLNDLNTRIEELSTDNTNQFTAIDERMTYFDEGIDDLELIVSSSLNDLNTRVETNLSTINSLLNKIDELTQRVTALESANTSA